MSDTKPSKAARELADAMCPDLKPHDLWIMAGIVQSHLGDLLEKADKVLFLAHDHVSPLLAKELRLQINRWKPENK